MGGTCLSWHLKEFQKSLGPETKALRQEALSAAARYLKFDNYSFLSHFVQIQIRWDVSLRYQVYNIDESRVYLGDLRDLGEGGA